MGLTVTDLSCTRGGRLVLHGLSFALDPGETLILRGPNGAGKSTLLRALAGLLPVSGRIEIDGRPAGRDARTELVAYAGHLDAVKLQLTVAENLAFWAGLLGGDPAPALAAFDLGPLAHRPAHLCSAGQRRRLGLARLLLAPRRLWLLDEPTVALDAAATARLLAALRAHAAAGGLTVIATHVPLDLAPARTLTLAPEAAADARAAADPFLAGSLGMSAARAVLARELALAFRSGGGAGLGLAFFLIVVLLVPLGVGPDPGRLAGLAAGTLWIGALLACLLSLDRLFQADHEDGTLDILALAPLPLEALVALKALAHWLTTGLPLTAAAPLLALTLQLPAPAYPWLAASLAAGTPGLSFLGAIGAAVTVGIRRGGLLLSILVLPLYLPTLIFGARAAAAAADGADPWPAFLLLAGLTLFILALAPFAAAAALRANLR